MRQWFIFNLALSLCVWHCAGVLSHYALTLVQSCLKAKTCKMLVNYTASTAYRKYSSFSLLLSVLYGTLSLWGDLLILWWLKDICTLSYLHHHIGTMICLLCVHYIFILFIRVYLVYQRTYIRPGNVLYEMQGQCTQDDVQRYYCPCPK